MAITSDESVLGGEPRIAGTRIGVRHVAGKIIDGGYSPAYVADQFDIPLASVHEALAYYYDNIDEIREYRRENAEARKRMREELLKPKTSVS